MRKIGPPTCTHFYICLYICCKCHEKRVCICWKPSVLTTVHNIYLKTECNKHKDANLLIIIFIFTINKDILRIIHIHISNIGVFLWNLLSAKSKTCFDRNFSAKTKSLKQLIYVNFQKLQSLNSPYVILRPGIKFSHEATSSIHLLF
jgi:hypothetical protein